jgi:hypothetical protein
MIHYLRLFIVIYAVGFAVTASLMLLFGVSRDGERWPAWFGGYDGKFLVFWLLLWPVSLPIVLYLLLWPRGPREVDLDEESVDL